MYIKIDVRKRLIEDWLKKEREYSEISQRIAGIVAQLGDDNIPDAKWAELLKAIEGLEKMLERVSTFKHDLAKQIAELHA